MPRIDQRANDAIRPTHFKTNFVPNSDGSVLAVCGNTQVICTVNFAKGVPGWMKAQDVPGGWLTAEYAMLPGSTHSRVRRENKSGPSGRSSEIQRLIGRSLRAIVDLEKLGAHTVNIDCDVLNADGGTRCTAINGAYVAMKLAVDKLTKEGALTENPIKEGIAAISVGILDEVICDLCYEEDSAAEVDMNVVKTSGGRYIEIQGTAEGMTFAREELNELLSSADKGIEQIISAQNLILN